MGDEDDGGVRNEGERCFQARHIPGVKNKLADGIKRWKEESIAERLKFESPEIGWQVQELGAKKRQLCAEILREDMYLEEFQLRLTRLTKGVGGYWKHRGGG